MTGQRDTEELLERLVADGEARRRVPPMRVTLGLFALLAAVIAGLYLRFGIGLRPDFAGRLSGDPRFGVIWVGLSVLAVGAALWVVASGVPGRGALARTGRGVALCGALLGFVLAPLLVLLHVGSAGLHAGVHDFACMGGAVRIAVLPALALVAWVLWSAPSHPERTALCATLGAGALGAALVHATCPDADAAHWLTGHALAPLAAAFLAAIPVWMLVRWQLRRRPPL